MKSLFSSTATFAVAISLAGTAHAQDAALVGPFMDGNDGVAELSGGEILAAEAPLAPSTLPALAPESLKGDAVLALDPAVARDIVGDQLARSVQAGESVGLVTSEGVVTPQSVTANYGTINPFYGNIGAFWGTINPFYGTINPFYGNIGAFWGDISPFYGNIGAFWGTINPFYGNIGAFQNGQLGELADFWQGAATQINTIEGNWSALKYTTSSTGAVTITFDGTPDRIRNSIEALIAAAEAKYGAAYFARTGKSFRAGFVAAVLARHGIDLANTANAKKTLAKTAAQRFAFFLDWHDSLMLYSGINSVDHWMGQVNWTPAITKVQGSGERTLVGVVDGSFDADADVGENVVWVGGGTTSVGGHGAGVASLIAGAHDGEGVMGIAPEVRIAAYNPFDADGTTDWARVGDGIESLIYDAYIGGSETGYVSIINLSLGESGMAFSQGLADVLRRPRIAAYNDETIYVVAAGNDGISQTRNVDWTGNQGTHFILVGSVDPNNQISSFSNRPGSACLTINGACSPGNELYRRTVVAPGSLMLVSDGNGGVTRVSGTSFAAPLVSGAVALLHDRWPWLARHPEETAQIIFRSARDLGAPGPDEVYGWGMLDVRASQSPLNFGAMRFQSHRKFGFFWLTSWLNVSSLLSGGLPSWWENDGVYFTAWEDIGGTYRDFLIPMSSKAAKTSNALGNGYQQMQDFVSDRFANWLLSGGLDKNGDGKLGVRQTLSNTNATRDMWTMRFDTIAPNFEQDGAVRPVHNAATLTDPRGNVSFTLGYGQGAMALASNNRGIISDSNYQTGGVNPVLGFASGEMFAGATVAAAGDARLTFGYAKNREDWKDLRGVSDYDRQLQRELGSRDAEALTVGIEEQVTKNFSINTQYTHLREKNAVLGAQTSADALLGKGAATDALTLSARWDVGDGILLDLSATAGVTDLADGQLFASSQKALSTAGQFSLTKRGLVGERDIVRLTFGQPLTVESGEIEFRNTEVIDRETGEMGVVSQYIGIDTKRRYMGEVLYATPITRTSVLGVMARYVTEGGMDQDKSIVLGANFGLRF